jgi:AcrR family transcriptional regulator
VAAQLPILDGDALVPRVRADATRNREKILYAAATLVAEHGIEHVSVDDIARAARVGTGTVYRRFGDRAGLALALLDEHTRAFQDALIGGAPPLGPGVPARERLMAFGDAYLDFLDLHADVLFAAGGQAHNTGGPVALYATHLSILLREAAPRLDADFTARALLDAVSPGAHLFARRRLAWSLDRQKAGWRALVAALSAPSPA